MQDRYVDLIERIVTTTLKGKIRSKQQVYQMLQADITAGTGELFERCLQAQVDHVQTQLQAETDELKQAKALRKQRALKTIAAEWDRWQQQNQANSLLSAVVAGLQNAPPEDQLLPLLQALDPNQTQVLSRSQLQELAQQLAQTATATEATAGPSLQQIAAGLTQGLTTWDQLEGQVISWIYEQGQRSIGFGSPTEQRGPWSHWAKQVSTDRLKALLTDLATHQAITAAGMATPLNLQDWVEMAVVLQRLQLGLVSWFDQQPYDPKAGKRLSIATFLSFTIVWSQLSQRCAQLSQPQQADGGFQMALQVLVQFARQDYFPLYGGLFTALSGEPLQTMLDYLDQPLRQAPNTESKARILTLLGYSQRALGRYESALRFHQQALTIARDASDQRCEIANLNHLGRTYVQQQDYAAAIDHSQRALIMARQMGDRLGEANALANVGYSEVIQAQANNPLDPEPYDRMLTTLQQGLALSEQVGDRPSQALCANSLGIAQVVLGQHQTAVTTLEQGLQIAQAIGDIALQGQNYAYLATAHQNLGHWEAAIVTGSLGMYLLHQIDAPQWRQPASIVAILYGQLGPDAFQAIWTQHRSQFLPHIGVDGYDYLPKLLADYRRSLQ